MTKCRSCAIEHTIYFRYGPSCGARVVRERLTLRVLFREFIEALTNLEGPVWNTLRDLTLRPRLATQGLLLVFEGGT